MRIGTPYENYTITSSTCYIFLLGNQSLAAAKTVPIAISVIVVNSKKIVRGWRDSGTCPKACARTLAKANFVFHSCFDLLLYRAALK